VFLKRIRLFPFVIITLPVWLLILWFIWGSFQDFYNRELRIKHYDSVNITWFMQQKMHALWDGFKVKDINSRSALKTFNLQIERHLMDSLMTDLPVSIQKYQKGWLVDGNKYIPVKIRHRGSTAPHWFYKKKSVKIKLPKNHLLKNSRIINLITYKRRIYIDYPVIMKICKLAGCLHTNVEPVRLFINNDFYGYYFRKEEIDESWLRTHGFMAGNLYEGENCDYHRIPGFPSHLFLYPSQWEKTAVFNRRPEEDRRDLKKLISMINTLEQRIHLHRRYDYRNILNPEHWDRFCAAITLIGSYHQDNRHNWMIFFDPFTAKFSPILHDPLARDTRSDVDIHSGSQMLALYLQNPLNIFEKDKLVWEFLQTKTDSILHSIKIMDSLLLPEFEADRFKNHGTADDFHAHTQIFFEIVGGQFEFLKQRLSNARVALKTKSDRLILCSFGQSPAVMKSVFLSRKDGKALNKLTLQSLRLWRDLNLNGYLDKADEPVSYALSFEKGIAKLKVEERLFPGRTEPNFKDNCYERGIDPAPLNYTYFINVPEKMDLAFDLELENVITGEAVELEKGYFPEGQAYSIHPWRLKTKGEEEIIWRGTVKLTENLIIPVYQTLIIKAGTLILMNEKVSLTCFGKCFIQGNKNAPVRFIPAEKEKPWGAFSIVGTRADSSKINYADFSYGTGDDRGLFAFTGMVQVHAANGVVFENCRFSNNIYEDDTFHGVYCDVKLIKCRFENAASDAIDLDYCSGKIINCTFKYCGNDGIDLMTSSTVVEDNKIYCCGDKGISVGERSRPVIINNHLVNNNIGIEVKDNSFAFVQDNVIMDNNVGINAYKKNWRYSEGGFAEINDCIFRKNIVDFTLDKNSFINVQNSILSVNAPLPAQSLTDSIGFHIDSISIAKYLAK